ncbi:hypothetical protein [Streptomyces halstedii]|uniref:DNA-binding phage zinc finger domain-containing protein n=1 Tax=Streptomyces halstedii TaxID=1944 RepID=A0A6N9U8A0_STRHA|nr:hypothetical protein [Streptomyces halstedii]NEA19838.1 hypothetical protein [Streptomyces halstedii]
MSGLTLDQLRTVPCGQCGAPAGEPCTSHQGTRVRRNDVHQARTKTYQEAQR